LKKLVIPLLIFSTLVTLTSLAHAYEKRTIRASGLIGQVGLLGDPGNGGANGLGLAGALGFQVTEPLAFEIRYLGSLHSDVDHRDLSVGAEYNLADFESGTPHLQAGMSFIHNAFKTGAVGADAAGLYLGAGLDFELAKSLQIGPEVRVVKAFSTHGLVNGRDITTVGDEYSVMIRFSYLFEND
jgi:hypothetical protein